MAKFKKAKPEQQVFKMSIYGPQGSGKTFTTLLFAEGLAKKMGKRIAYCDTEHGSDFYAQAVPQRQVHKEAFDFDAIYTRSLAEILSAVKSLDFKEHGVVVIDSMSHMWDAAMDAYSGKRTKVDSIPMHAWSKIKKPYKELVNFLMGCPAHVFLLGRQKNLFETDSDTGEMRKTGVAMRAEGETPYEPHICLRTECKINVSDTTKSVYNIYVEKDRTGVLSGQTIQNPTFKTISPLLALFGDSQAQPEDEVERVAMDADMLHESEQTREQKKSAKSDDLFTSMHAKIVAAKSLDDMGDIAKTLKKEKKYLMEGAENALREIYQDKQKALVKGITGEG